MQSPLFQLIQEYLDPEHVVSSGIKLRVATVTRDTGILRYVNERGDLEDKGGQVLHNGLHNATPGRISIRDGVKASSAIPLVFQPWHIDGVAYWDGAIREDVPVRKAVELGATNLVIVLCNPRQYRATPLAGVPTEWMVPALKGAMHLMDIMADQVFQDDLDSTLNVLKVLHELGWDASVRNILSRVRSFPLPRDAATNLPITVPKYKVIEPPFILGEITEFEPEIISANIELGEIVAAHDLAESFNPADKKLAITRFLVDKVQSYRRAYETAQRAAGPPPGKEGHNRQRFQSFAGTMRTNHGLAKRFEIVLRQYNGDAPLPGWVVARPA